MAVFPEAANFLNGDFHTYLVEIDIDGKLNVLCLYLQSY